MKRVAIGLLAIVLAANLLMLVSDKRVLVSGKLVRPGQTYVIADYGNLGAAGQSSLVCTFWTGRSFIRHVYWYSSNGIMGKDSCPFVASGEQEL